MTTDNAMCGAGGGVQLCTQDYLLLLRAAGYELNILSFSIGQQLWLRVLGKVSDIPSWRRRPRDLPQRVLRAIASAGAELVFFNYLDYPDVAAKIRDEYGPRIKLVHLSHGLDSTDISVAQQAERQNQGILALDTGAASALGAKLQFEADYRRYLDAVLCLSPLDAELERWLGVPRSTWYSRPVREAPLACRPVNGRIGCVTTLDHPPNHIGLSALFAELNRRNSTCLDFRLVGSPARSGEEFARRYRFVSYLGRLSDADLQAEASTWCSFVHPLFNYARGCSTKIAVVLGWGLPIATTTFGTRGYIWNEYSLPLAATAYELAESVFQRANLNNFDHFKAQTHEIARLQPSMDELSHRIRAFVDSLAVPS